MKAEKVIYNLLSNHAPLIAVVPAARIFPSLIPLNTTLPAIAYSMVSQNEETAIGLTNIKNRARMQITVAVKGVNSTAYGQVKSIIKLITDACNHKQGTFNGVSVDSVILELTGPDLRDDEAAISYQTVDFRVTYV
jgi:hypothetical protein